MTITPREFVDTWAASKLREQQAAQDHFTMLCDLVNHKTPAQLDPAGEFFTFEEQVEKATGGSGRADVWYKDHFAWEYKGKHKDLDAAYAQLSSYRGGLGNPPLLVVCDFLEYRIYPQWTNRSGLPFIFHNEDLLNPETRRYITWLLESPWEFLELRKDERERRERITRDLAGRFAELAGLMRNHSGPKGKPKWEPMRIARFLAKLTFALFAEDIKLLPRPFEQSMFRYLVENCANFPEEFVPQMEQLFKAMDGQIQSFLMKPIPYFNGGLFRDSAEGANDGTEALDLTEIPGGLDLLGKASDADWRYVNPTIFGTLFEGALDESKRAQLGAHYTSEEDIRLIVEPVLMDPLNHEWQAVQTEADLLMQTYLAADTPKTRQQAYERLVQLNNDMMSAIENTKVLDPACGSGNFLYVSLQALKDLEGKVRKTFEPLNLPFRDVVTPRQLYGIEKDEFASKLAQIVVWVGYLQWRYEHESELHPFKKTSNPHPRQLPNPIFQDRYGDEPDHIQCDDAIMRYDAKGKPYEPEWPAVDVIIGNPPFLGAKKLIGELGEKYVEDVRSVYENRLPGFSDLVTFWFEKARNQLEHNMVKRVGLLATNSIGMGTNLTVLKNIKETGDIFWAWSDREWILQGAAVRVAMVGFDLGVEVKRHLDGLPVEAIFADLTAVIDLTSAKVLPENESIGFIGTQKTGPFDISNSQASEMLAAKNTSGRNNSDVIFRYYNATDLIQRYRNVWIIDFGTNMSETEASQYKLPFEYVKANVFPVRENVRRAAHRDRWWLHGDARPGMRRALAPLSRFMATPAVSKHRIFAWLKMDAHPDHALVVFARDDDYFFGALHSYPHEIWSLRLGTWLGKGNDPRYTPTTTFETFPLPYTPGKEPTRDPVYRAISEAARQLNEEREAWLNPPDLINLFAEADAKALRERTLTNLYNALEEHRVKQANGNGNGLTNGKPAAFAPRLAELHAALDNAVLHAYGWDDLIGKLRTSEGDEELLTRLLALNIERSAGG